MCSSGFFVMVRQPVLGERTQWIQTSFTALKNWYCVTSWPCRKGFNRLLWFPCFNDISIFVGYLTAVIIFNPLLGEFGGLISFPRLLVRKWTCSATGVRTHDEVVVQHFSHYVTGTHHELGFDLVWFGLIWLGFMSYQSFQVI